MPQSSLQSFNLTSLFLPSAASSALGAETTPSSLLTGFSLEPLSRSLSSSQISIGQTETNLINSLNQVEGTFTLGQGQLTSNITSPFGNLQETTSINQLATDTIADLRQVTGVVNVGQGRLVSDLTTPGGQLQGSLDYADLLGNLTNALFDQATGTSSFENGQLNINISTALGAIAGTLNFGGSALVSNLTTPYGPIQGSFDFGDNAQVPVSLGTTSGTIDFSQGALKADLLPNLPGGEVAIPLNTLAGTVSLNQGQANVTVTNLPFGPVSTSFDISQLADDYVTNYFTRVSGSLNFAQGIVTSNLTGPSGSLAGTVDLADLVNDTAAFLNQSEGTVKISNGTVNTTLTTPNGPIAGSVDLSALAIA
jgi:hypothetical protein